MSHTGTRAAFVVGAVMLVAVTHLTPAQQGRPTFSGRWVLDTTRSEHGPLTPLAMVLNAEQIGDTLKVTAKAIRPTGEATSTSLFDLAGRPTQNSANAGGNPITLTATTRWDGASLIIKMTGDIQGQALVQSSMWSLSPDGNTLTQRITADVATQHLTAQFVLARESPQK